MRAPLWMSLTLFILTLSGSGFAQQKIAPGFLIYNRWLSWEEAQQGRPPTDGVELKNPWIFDNMRPTWEPFNGTGSYWYRLPKLPPGPYQLRVDFVSHGYVGWLWNSAEPERRQLITVGKPGHTEDEEISAAVRRIVPLTMDDHSEWYLVINFSFIGRETGGMWDEPLIAPGNTLGHQKIVHNSLVYGTCGSLIIMMAYMTMMFVRRPDDYPSFFLALICLGLLLRTVGVEMILCELFDPVKDSTAYTVSRRIEYLSIGLVNLAFLPFVTSTFKSVFHWKKVVLLVCVLSAAYMIACCFRSIESLRTDVHLIQILVVFSLAYIVRLLVMAVKNHEEGAFYMLAASIIPIVVFILELLHSRMGGNIRLGHFAGTLFVFLQSQLLAKRFATAFNRAEHLSQSLQSEVQKKTSQIRHIMDNIPEGLFIIDAKKTISPPYSRYLQVIFPNSTLPEQPILKLFHQHFQIPTHDLAMVDSILEASLNEDSINWEFNREHMAEQLLPAAGRSYRLHWHPIENAGKIVQFMGIIHDVTELQRLETEARGQEEDFRILKEFLQTPKAMMRSFLHKQSRLMNLILQESEGTPSLVGLKTIFAYLHTLKGNARQLHLKELSQLCHETEEPIRNAMGVGQVLTREEMQQNLTSLQTKMDRYKKVFIRFFGQEEDGSFSVFSAGETQQVKAWLEQNTDVPRDIREILRAKLGWDMKNWIEQLGRDQGLMVEVEGANECSGELRDALLDALGHLFRNSLVHGLQGRGETGRLTVQLDGTDALECVKVADNGLGLNVPRILQKAEELQLIEAGQQLTFGALAELIFAPIFSTADTVSDVAGRGIGMNAVRLLLEPFGASVYLEPQDPVVGLKKDVRGLAYIPFRTVISMQNDKVSSLASAL